MEDSKLIEILRTMKGRELGLFLEYVQSPYINKHQQLRELALYLGRFAPNFDREDKLRKEVIFNHLYPKIPYDDSTLYSLFSKLLRLAYGFLSQQAWEKEAGMAEIFLLRELRERQVGEKHGAAARKRFASISPDKEREEILTRWDNFLFYKELDLDFLTRGGRSYDAHLQRANDELDVIFIIEKLRMACDMLNRTIVTKAEYEATMLDTLMSYVDSPAGERLRLLPAVQIYRCILDTLREAEELEHYERLKTLLQAHYSEFGQEEAMNMFGYMLNYCIRKINAGQVRFYEEIWEHYRLLVDTKIIYIAGHLPPWEYKQIITTALRLGKADWCKAFAERYKADLPDDSRENSYQFNMAAIYYHDKQYREALLALQQAEFTDTTYQLGARILQVKAYYELNEGEALRSLIEAFLVYIRRNKEISDYRKTANSNFLRFTRKLYQCKSQWREKMISQKNLRLRLEELAAEMEESQPTANKDWLDASLQSLQAQTAEKGD